MLYCECCGPGRLHGEGALPGVGQGPSSGSVCRAGLEARLMGAGAPQAVCWRLKMSTLPEECQNFRTTLIRLSVSVYDVGYDVLF